MVNDFGGGVGALMKELREFEEAIGHREELVEKAVHDVKTRLIGLLLQLSTTDARLEDLEKRVKTGMDAHEERLQKLEEEQEALTERANGIESTQYELGEWIEAHGTWLNELEEKVGKTD